MSYRFPYEGLRVLDVSQGFAGPYAGGLLSLYGASVTKVEPPGGDWIREIGRAFDGNTPLGLVANRGKRSIALDLKTEAGRDIVHRLARDADIFIESFRPGVAARLGIDYDAIDRINPRILYLSVSGFGQNGPDTSRPATDTVIQAHSGFMSINKGHGRRAASQRRADCRHRDRHLCVPGGRRGAVRAREGKQGPPHRRQPDAGNGCLSGAQDR